MDALSAFLMSDELSDSPSYGDCYGGSYRSADEAPVLGVPVGEAESRGLPDPVRPDATPSLSLPSRPREVMQPAHET